MKPKINIDREKPTPGEIQSRKDFNSVLNKYNSTGGSAQTGASGKPFFKTSGFLVAAAAVVVTTVSVLVYEASRTEGPVATNSPVIENEASKHITSNTESVSANSAMLSKMHITPPIKGMDVPFQKYSVDAAKGGEFHTDKGASIHVPKNAFADDKGNAIKGEVELRFREFHNPIDFFLCGIPMSYDSAGVRYQFESAGMVELLGFREGKPVYILPGKKVDIELDSKRKGGTEYNVYKFDTASCNWVYLGKDKAMKSKNSTASLSENSANGSKTTPEIKAIDQKVEEVQKAYDAKVEQLPALPAEPQQPKKFVASRPFLKLDVKEMENDFPELKPYEDAKFEVGEETPGYSPDMMKTVTFEDIKVSDGPKKGVNLLFVLKKGLVTTKLIVYPVYEGKAYDKLMSDYNKVEEKYNLAKNNRLAEEKKIREEEGVKVSELTKKREDLQHQYETAQQGKRYTNEKELNDHMASLDNYEKVMNSFSVTGFGIYNCDKPSAYPKGVTAHIRLKDESGKELNAKLVYLVDKSKNGLFSWYNSDIKDFSFNPSSTNALFTVIDNRIYCLRNDELVLVKDGSASDLKLKEVKQEFKNADEIRAYMGI
jgi:hypothetical protein